MNKRVQKPMRIITNSKCLADELHLKYSDQQAQKTEVAKSVKKLGSIYRSIGYSQECFPLKGSMYKSVAKELKMRHRNSVPILMLQAGTTVSNSHLVDQWHETEVAAGERLEAWDDLTGLSLDPKGVLNARRQELEYIAQKNVWDVVPREEARRNGWKIIKSRWIDVNKGDDISAQYRSRLVGKEFAGQRTDGLFAGTQPLEAL